MNSLKETITNHTANLGNNYENLGKTVGSCFWKKKILLSHDIKNGWNVVQLNYISLLFRKLGFFKSTHLKTIVDELTETTTRYYNPILNEKIKALWEKSHPQEPFPSYFVILGNSDPKDAQIKLFCDVHDDKIVEQAIGYEINESHEEGDKILVEAWPRGKTSKAGQHNNKYINPDYIVQGWEPENIAEIRNECLGKQDVIDNFCAAMEAILNFKLIEQIDDFIDLERKIITFLKLYVESALYTRVERDIYSSKVQEIRNSLFELNTAVAISGININFKEKLSELLLLIAKMYKKIIKESKKYHYCNLTEDNYKKIAETFKERNESLGQEIDRNCQQGHRVFVIAGGAHLLKYTKGIFNEFPVFSEAVEDLHRVLKKHKFVIYFSRKDIAAKGVIDSYPGLQIY